MFVFVFHSENIFHWIFHSNVFIWKVIFKSPIHFSLLFVPFNASALRHAVVAILLQSQKPLACRHFRSLYASSILPLTVPPFKSTACLTHVYDAVVAKSLSRVRALSLLYSSAPLSLFLLLSLSFVLSPSHESLARSSFAWPNFYSSSTIAFYSWRYTLSALLFEIQLEYRVQCEQFNVTTIHHTVFFSFGKCQRRNWLYILYWILSRTHSAALIYNHYFRFVLEKSSNFCAKWLIVWFEVWNQIYRQRK